PCLSPSGPHISRITPGIARRPKAASAKCSRNALPTAEHRGTGLPEAFFQTIPFAYSGKSISRNSRLRYSLQTPAIHSPPSRGIPRPSIPPAPGIHLSWTAAFLDELTEDEKARALPAAPATRDRSGIRHPPVSRSVRKSLRIREALQRHPQAA